MNVQTRNAPAWWPGRSQNNNLGAAMVPQAQADEQEALLERAARRHELISRLGHELRTPVTVVLGMAQALAKGSAPVEQHAEIVETLVDRAQALARLVQRFEAAVETGLTEWADVNEVAAEVAESFPRVEVVPSGTAAMAGLNRVAARRILEELVENALAFSPEEEAVTVSVSVIGGSTEVRVTDRGSGVDAAMLEPGIIDHRRREALGRIAEMGDDLGASADHPTAPAALILRSFCRMG